jgi:hypothetical protein
MKGGAMANFRRKNGNGKKFPGQPKMCKKPPGEGACLKQLKSPKPGICVNCQAKEILTIKIKTLGR